MSLWTLRRVSECEAFTHTSLTSFHLCMSQPQEPINFQRRYSILIYTVSRDGCCQKPGLYRMSIAVVYLTGQNQYFNGSLNHVHWLQFAVKLVCICPRWLHRPKCWIHFTAWHRVCLAKHQNVTRYTESKHCAANRSFFPDLKLGYIKRRWGEKRRWISSGK